MLDRPPRADRSRAARRERAYVRRALRRPRPVQDGQRHARSRGRRPAPHRGGARASRRRVRETDTVARRRRRRVRRAVRSSSTSVHHATDVAERIIDALTEPFQLGGEDASVSASIGIALCPDGAAMVEALVANADIAMYRAKEQRAELLRAVRRRDAAVGHDPDRARDRACGTRSRATSCGSCYQPIIDADDACVRGFEALVRWERPGFGLVPPDEFIAVAEDTGLIIEIGVWVLDARVTKPRRGRKRWPELRLGISVNVSSRQLASRDIVDTVKAAHRAHRARPDAAHARAHREHAHRRHAQHAGDPERAAQPRREPLARRLRYGLLVAHVPALVPDQHREDRQVVRADDRYRTGGHRDRCRRDRARQATSTSASWPRASRRRSSSRCSSSCNASTSRATCSRSRGPVPMWPASSRPRRTAVHRGLARTPRTGTGVVGALSAGSLYTPATCRSGRNARVSIATIISTAPVGTVSLRVTTTSSSPPRTRRARRGRNASSPRSCSGPVPLPASLGELSPWIDARFMGPIEPILAGVDAQEHRRFVKSHLAADGLRFFPEAKYIVVGRDTRDVFMSMYNHYSVVHRRHVLAVQRRRTSRRGVPALPGNAADAVAAMDQRRLVRLGARRLADLVASPPPHDVVGVARHCRTSCSCTTATCGGPRRGDASHRHVLRHRGG